MTAFLHISPTAYLNKFCVGQSHHLLLAHLIESDEKYREWYRANKATNPDDVYIMDNSMFEMYKQGKPAYPSEKLLEMAQEVHADYIVLSDYPKEPFTKTIEAAQDLAPTFKNAGFKTFFVPQGEEGNLPQLINSFRWASTSELIDYIGVSILAVPLAYGFGIEKGNKLQRFLSRWHFMNLLDNQTSVLSNIVDHSKKLHFLGMVDGPNEIMLVHDFLGYIDTWDSSAAVWAGLNGISFDTTPSGLLDGKFEKHVDFAHDSATDKDIALAFKNINIINGMLESYTGEH